MALLCVLFPFATMTPVSCFCLDGWHALLCLFVLREVVVEWPSWPILVWVMYIVLQSGRTHSEVRHELDLKQTCIKGTRCIMKTFFTSDVIVSMNN